MGQRDRMASVADPLPATAPTADVLYQQRLVQASTRSFGLKSAMAFGVHYGHLPLPPESQLAAAYASAAREVTPLISWTSCEAALLR